MPIVMVLRAASAGALAAGAWGGASLGRGLAGAQAAAMSAAPRSSARARTRSSLIDISSTDNLRRVLFCRLAPGGQDSACATCTGAAHGCQQPIYSPELYL